MITRAVPFDESYQQRIQKLGVRLAAQGDPDATVVLTLALAWEFAPEVPPLGYTCTRDEAAFRCGHIDESAGLAEVHELDPHSRRVHAS